MSDILDILNKLKSLKSIFGNDQKRVEKFLKEDETVTQIDDGYGGFFPSLRNVIKQMFDRIAEITQIRDDTQEIKNQTETVRDETEVIKDQAQLHEQNAESFANSASAAANGDVIHAHAIIFPNVLDKNITILDGQTALVGFKEIDENGSFEVLGHAEHI